jgi:alkylation response protein AidB-like acyl-CoA dehydrogenase
MYDFLLSEEEKALKAEARRFAKEDVPSSLIRSMDADQIRYPREYLEKAASRGLLGLRFATQWGGRAAKWTGEVAALEEIGVLGSSLSCLYSLVSIVGEAHLFGTDEQKKGF